MKTGIIAFGVVLLLCAGLGLAAADTKPTLLGAREVGFRVDRDEILVGLREGLFSKNDLEMLRVVVTYANGVADTIPVRHIFKEGSRSRIIDLPGRKRIIRKIVFFYQTSGPVREGRALVKVYGL